MNIRSAGFIGAGRVTRIMLGGFKNAGVDLPDIVVSDTDPAVMDRLCVEFPDVHAAGPKWGETADQDLVVLAVHPPAMASVLAEMKARLRPETIVVSLAPKITLARMIQLLGGFTGVVRMIPNAPSIIGCGYNPVAYGENLSAEDRASVKRFFEPLGECPEVAESKLEGFALMTGMGPTYLWFQLETLRELASEFGLDKGDAVTALMHMVRGSVLTLLDAGLSPEEVLDLIPVKPLQDEEDGIRQAYRDRLTALYTKIRP